MKKEDSANSGPRKIVLLNIALILVLLIGWAAFCREDVRRLLGAFKGETMEDQAAIAEWTQIPLVSEENLAAGVRKGGEGGQWPHTLEVSRMDSDLILYGTNTGGIHRSTDGGESWELCVQGMFARGANAFAIDPCNDQYILAVGSGDQANNYCHGIYASSDRGRTWECMRVFPISGNKVYLDGLEFDAASFDPEQNKCMTAYFSTPFETEQETLLERERAGLYRSFDGGRTWKLANSEMTDAEIWVDPASGDVYAARRNGLYISKDRGNRFSCIYEGEVTGCDIFWETGRIYICSSTQILEGTSQTGFSPLESAAIPDTGPISHISVSPLNSDHLLIQVDEPSQIYRARNQIYASKDGGITWTRWSYDARKDFLPYDSFEKIFAWSYEDENKAWSFGGEFVIASSDGGENWMWSSEGICGVLCGGRFHFNVFNPDLMYVGAQDLNGAITADGGRTWEYVDMSRKGTSGHVYGGYAASRQVFWGCLSDSWEGEKHITITFDGGNTFIDTPYIIDSDIADNNDISSYQSYNNPEIFFAGNYRSMDGGITWERMGRCLQVYSHNPEGAHELYGCEKGSGYVLVSYDEGESWERVNQEEIPLTNRRCLSEVQVDPKNQTVYAAANGTELYSIDLESGELKNLTAALPADLLGNIRVNGIAVDSKNNRLYVSGSASRNLRNNTLLCSEDGGSTWYDATSEGETYKGADIANACCIRIHPETGELWCSTSCFGFVKLSAE